jgi:hypothetical protein
LASLRHVPLEVIMSEAELRRVVRDRFGLRIEPEMSRYLVGRSTDLDQSVAVIGSDARTGVPRREILDLRLPGRECQ